MLWWIVAPDTISAHDVSVKILHRFRPEHSCPHHNIFKKRRAVCRLAFGFSGPPCFLFLCMVWRRAVPRRWSRSSCETCNTRPLPCKCGLGSSRLRTPGSWRMCSHHASGLSPNRRECERCSIAFLVIVSAKWHQTYQWTAVAAVDTFFVCVLHGCLLSLPFSSTT